MIAFRFFSKLISLPVLGAACIAAVLLLLAFGCVSESVSDQKPVSIPNEFIRAKGRSLVVGSDDRSIFLRGVCFGNEVWSNVELPVNHHNETDYKRVRDMGMNAIRFYMNYKTFESDANPYQYKQSGWDWIDKNVAWAKQYGISLILNIHVPQGGFQSNGEGMALWNDSSNQSRLTTLWKAIAARYANEPVIAAYDLLNEPVVSSSADQWKNLSQRMTNEIRKVDTNHLIVIERLLGVKGKWETYADLSVGQFTVSDPQANLMYDFHFYSPIEYSHQNTPWTGLPDDGPYPEESIVSFPSDLTWAGLGGETNVLQSGDSDWTLLSSALFQVTDASIISIEPVFVPAGVGGGRVRFDDFTVKEYDESKAFVREVVVHDSETKDGWGLWSENGSGSVSGDGGTTHRGASSIVVMGTTGAATSYLNKLRFVPKTGFWYSVQGYAKGSSLPKGSACRFRFDLQRSPSGELPMKRNKEYLSHEIDKLLAFGEKNNVPMNIGEFGLYKDCFVQGKGGLAWVSDMLSIIIDRKLNFTYHSYHEYGSFGIYRNLGLPDPADANTPLIELFASRLGSH
jgi:endoglucanase